MSGADVLTVQPKRDRYGRYLLAGCCNTPHTRATTIAGVLADNFSLTAWKMRQVAIGIGRRADLHAMAASTPPDDRKTLDGICNDASEAAGASSGRNLGTALHSFVEAVNLGHDVDVPAIWQPHIDCYREAIAAAGLTFEPGMVERIVTNHTLSEPVAGTFDGIGSCPGDTLPRIIDLKTGSSVDYGAGEWATQLAIYATAEHLYDLASDTITPMPAVDQDHAYIIHLPSGANPPACNVYELDIAAGRGALTLALEVRAWRKRKGLLSPISPGSAGVVSAGEAQESVTVTPPRTVADPARRQMTRDTIAKMPPAERRMLVAAWPVGVPTLKASDEHTDAQLTAIDDAIRNVWSEADADFTEPVERVTVPVELRNANAELPEDLRLDVPRLAAPDALQELTTGVDDASALHDARRTVYGQALELLGPDVARVVGCGMDKVTAQAVERLTVLLDAPDGLLGIDPDTGNVVVLDVAAIKAQGWTGAPEIIAAAKAHAAAMGVKAPTSAKAAMADPLIAAALLQ